MKERGNEVMCSLVMNILITLEYLRELFNVFIRIHYIYIEMIHKTLYR